MIETKAADRLESAAEDARRIFEAGLARVRADELWTDVVLGRIRERVRLARRVMVVGAGKASMALAGTLEQALKPEQVAGAFSGLVIVPTGYPAHFPLDLPRPNRIRVVEGGHPVPNQPGVTATKETLEMVRDATKDDLVIALVSGGGSSLWALFEAGIPLEMGQQLFRRLLHAGADIEAMNTVRKQLSLLAGGGLARAAYPASIEAFVLSDVPGDDESVIASGPVSPAKTTARDAIHILKENGLWDEAPQPIRSYIGQKASASTEQEARFDHVRTTMLGTNGDAQRAAAEHARSIGYTVVHGTEPLSGEARSVGQQLVSAVASYQGPTPACWIWGGETTVTVTGNGKGGRNQELALAAALSMGERTPPMVLLSGGTDGVDGPTDAAGAWVTSHMVHEARAQGLDLDQALSNNDAYPILDSLGLLIRTGPTHTNVMDLVIALRL